MYLHAKMIECSQGIGVWKIAYLEIWKIAYLEIWKIAYLEIWEIAYLEIWEIPRDEASAGRWHGSRADAHSTRSDAGMHSWVVRQCVYKLPALERMLARASARVGW